MGTMPMKEIRAHRCAAAACALFPAVAWLGSCGSATLSGGTGGTGGTGAAAAAGGHAGAGGVERNPPARRAVCRELMGRGDRWGWPRGAGGARGQRLRRSRTELLHRRGLQRAGDVRRDRLHRGRRLGVRARRYFRFQRRDLAAADPISGTTQPLTSVNAIWGTSPTFIVGAGNSGLVLQNLGSGWHKQTVGDGGNTFYGVAGAGASDIWAVGRPPSPTGTGNLVDGERALRRQLETRSTPSG